MIPEDLWRSQSCCDQRALLEESVRKLKELAVELLAYVPPDTSAEPVEHALRYLGLDNDDHRRLHQTKLACARRQVIGL